MRISRWLFVPVLLAFFACPAPARAGYVYAIIDPAGSDGEEVDVNGLNARGQAVGSYIDLDGTYHGFVRDAGGSIASFTAAPGADYTFALAINNIGEVAGFYHDGGGQHGFLRDSNGLLTTVVVPGAIKTAIDALNASGASAGTYVDASNLRQGFIRLANGIVTTFTLPNATNVFVSSINASGMVSGAYSDAAGVTHGFLRAADGSYTVFDSPGSMNTPVLVNDAGLVAGSYNIGGYPYHGYSRDTSGTLVPFEVPGGTSTFVNALNNAGAIGGQYDAFGFVRGPDGSFTTLVGPGDVGGTYVTALNDWGQAAGSYTDSDFRNVGFIATAVPEPNSIVLLASGVLAGLAWYRCRSRREARFGSPGRSITSFAP
jgi:hypothetical protein